ncbi:MAG: TIGR00153 family protein [Phycisphaerae bacterium]|jgi:predicted phosphate transport protein (TIGR00153 family)|nr:TIGR00153 family protein [Phycisphaerae bacterium]
MRSLNGLFGRSPFEPLIEHARKVHECVALVRPVADAVIARDAEMLDKLQHEMSKTEFEADQLKDRIRQALPKRYFLPVNREDVAKFLSEMDKVADDTEDFAIVATFRSIVIPDSLKDDFLALVDKVLEVSELLLSVAEELATLQREAFSGPESNDVLMRIQDVCHAEWESDKLSRRIARHIYSDESMNPINILLIEKLCRSLTQIADHAENVGKNMRLMISRR